MRISTLQAFNNGVNGIQRNYANATRTQEQISTGNRILTPADDPVASVRLLQLEQQQNVLSQYNSNLTAAKNSLTQEEVSLNSVNTILQRVRELAVQAGNGALDPQDRKSIAAELGEREDELLSLMNTRNARGEYLFSGFQGKTQPFVRGADGSYSYQGDEGQRKLQIASSLNIPISDNGKSIFESVTNAGRLGSQIDMSLAPAGSTLRVSSPLVQDEVAYSGTPPFPAAGIEIVFGDAPAEDTYQIRDIGTGAFIPDSEGALDSKTDTSDTLIFRGVHINLDGDPTGGERAVITPGSVSISSTDSGLASTSATRITDPVAFQQAFPNGSAEITFEADVSNPPDGMIATVPAVPDPVIVSFGPTAQKVDFPGIGISVEFDPSAMPAPGSDLTISYAPHENKQGILNTIAGLRMALESPDNNNIGVRDAVAVSLTNLDHGMVSVDAARGNIGARLNTIETTQTDNEDVTLVNKGVQADLRELDYAEALSRLSMQTVILEAAQQSYVKISGLSLFNVMR